MAKFQLIDAEIGAGADIVKGYRVQNVATKEVSPFFLHKTQQRKVMADCGMSKPRAPRSGKSGLKAVIGLAQRNDYSSWTPEELASLCAACTDIIKAASK